MSGSSTLIPRRPASHPAARTELAYATVELCSAYLDMLRRRHEADLHGEAMDLGARVLMVSDHHIEECRAFLAALQRGGTVEENLRVVQVAVHGFSRQFDVDQHTLAAGERMLVDFMLGVVNQLQAPTKSAVLSPEGLDG
jgi:hypothetical protein